jgi:gephyrin
MLSIDEALDLIAKNTPPPQVVKLPVNEALIGYVLAEAVAAPEAVPAFRASIVDGYAIRIPSSGTFVKGIYPISMVSHAQAIDLKSLEEGEIARITTGAPLPPGADAVIMVEDTILTSMTADDKEEKEVEILTSEVVRGENVREVGSDVEAGTIILRKGEGISAVGGELGLLASVGVKEISVYKKPVIGVLSTGDEIVQHDREGGLKLGEVRDTNRPTLITAVKGTGFEAVDLGIVSDKYSPLQLPSFLRF